MSLKDNLRKLREKAGYEQAKDFAKVAKIPYSSYAVYERGSWPNESNLIKIATALHVSIDELLGYDSSYPNKADGILDFFCKIGYSAERIQYQPIEHDKPEQPGFKISTKSGRPFIIESDKDLIKLYQKIIFDKQSNDLIDNQRYTTALECLVDYEKDKTDEKQKKLNSIYLHNMVGASNSLPVDKLVQLILNSSALKKYKDK